MGVARQWAGRHDEQCESLMAETPDWQHINCLCLDRYIAAHTATPFNLHVLVIVESGVQVQATAHSTLADAKKAMRDFVIEAAQPNTVLYEELADLSLKVERGPDTTAAELIEYGISEIDLIDWWVGRDRDNEMRFYEVQDKRSTPRSKG